QQTLSAMAAIEEAKDTLEVRVAERTHRLAELNEQLLQEIQERTRAEEALAKAATTDYLTGLLNRRAMLAVLEQEEERWRRSAKPFSLVLADLDHFKRINDSLGHHAGDEVLIHLAQELRQTVRGQDAIARWGGEELLILLPETDLAGAVEVAEKVRTHLGDAPHTVGGHEVRVTVSLGVSTISEGVSINECIRRADAALYRAKEGGRNRTAT
ncbi:MAG: diguanylate cyclase, partial [Acidobacteriota bacterium]